MRKNVALGVVLSALAVALAAVLFACAQTPTSVPVRSFERAQRVDVVCLQIYDPVTGAQVLPRPLSQDQCAPVSATGDGRFLPNQLFALVTQTTRGELAVVDLTAGQLVDQARTVPGINFLPVGALPTDVAAAPDGQMAFVASAETNKPAIYGIPSRRLLGDTLGFPNPDGPPTLPSWPVCGLPQNPGALTVIARHGAPLPSPDAGADAGAAAGLPDYELIAVLPGGRDGSAKILVIDPRPFLRGGNVPTTPGPGAVLAPGALQPCPIMAAIELAGATAVPSSVTGGAAWADGVPYLDGGVDLTCDRPLAAPSCGLPPCCTRPSAHDAGGGGDAGATAACEPLGPKDAGAVSLDLGALEPPHAVAIAKDDHTLYVADVSVPFIHVLDVSTPGAPRELAPLVATSALDPSRTIGVKELALSPSTRDFKRFLYAVDATDGSLMVFDVTDPAATTRTPMLRPNPELNPFQPPDRVALASPVVAVAFARHDFPLSKINGAAIPNASAGLLCNPNPNLDANPAADLGFYYRPGSTDLAVAIGPRRLRGVFAFATLANGQVVTIDVDDWDAPCRRPVSMTGADGGALALAEPAPSSPADLDPFHAPNATTNSVTDEAFFPVSTPHRLRSDVLLKDDANTGNHLPRLAGLQQVTANGAVIPTSGPGSENLPLFDLRFARDVPDVHIDQDWAVTYEGALPGFDGLSATLASQDDYASLTVTQPNARFCAKGVEDWARGMDRASSILSELARAGDLAPPAGRLDRRITDYVQLSDEILGPGDPYWALPNSDVGGCWDDRLATPASRYGACSATFGAAGDQSTSRDFPILEAYGDHLVVGRYFTPAGGTREVVYKDPSNAPYLKLMRCCFHSQAAFRVRTGGVWSAVGSAVGGGAGVGFFSHLTTDGAGRCVASCASRESLLNGRIPSSPKSVTSATFDFLGRDSALAMRSPLFTLLLAEAQSGPPARDTVFAFTTKGQFETQIISVAGGTIQVSPQSMRYIEPLGQIAVVDGASQGLVLIDLSSVAVARAPYF